MRRRRDGARRVTLPDLLPAVISIRFTLWRLADALG